MTTNDSTVEIKPQPGPQTQFLASSADIVFYGGAAGGGKTYGLLMELTRHANHKGFGAVVFRRTTKQVRNEGGLWDTSENIYPGMGATPKESILEWEFPSGVSITFAHMEYEKNKLDWQGSQIPLICFDELTHFTETQFFYMFSRNRSTCGVKPYIRATCNPDADSWVAKFISWWIGKDGHIIPARSGAIRWFIRKDGQTIWSDSEEELIEQWGEDIPPKSFTFIEAKLEDNQILMKEDPAYLANLHALDPVEKERLLHGNWAIRPAAGLYFKRDWFDIVDAPPFNARKHRHWDFAATERSNKNKDPDWVSGLLISVVEGVYCIEDVQHKQLQALGVEKLVSKTAEIDGIGVSISAEQEPGSSGKMIIDHYARNVLTGYGFRGIPSSKSKIIRAQPASAAAENRNIKLVRGAWNHAFLDEIEAFPTKGVHDDQVDALSGAFNALNSRPKETSPFIVGGG